MTLVDSNVVIDILSGDKNWLNWSADALERCAAEGPLLINEIVFAEISVRSISEEAVRADLERLGIVLESTPVAALYLAAKVFERYRAAGGTRSSLLPDFFLGAHAQIAEQRIVTRDARRYRTHFPRVSLITPQG